MLFFKKLNCIVISCLMITMMSFSFFSSIKYFSDNLDNEFLTSHLNFHESDNPHHNDVDDYKNSIGHSHTHKHSENEEEHTHKHVNVITFSELIIYHNESFQSHSFDIYQAIPKSYNKLLSNVFVSEILRPPIYS